MSELSVVLPENHGMQCPLCGAPVNVATIGVAPTGEKGVIFDCCGNLVTMAAMRGAFGIDIPGLSDAGGRVEP